ncbi:alpha/beta hydrolase [Kitasatospora sp. NPDC050543]|uniref:alpha/beta hydrolase n=1 Tax=Kitasatospora sp. NPDC050543 TaxID=3364054 RepID=UPI0037B13A18
MTAFVLVSECYTGGWVWREVTDRLRGAGAEVYPATLTGLGDRRHLAAPGTDLETHIEDLVQLIDHVDAPEVVIVGHGYGIHPVLGAADRRPERIGRIVYLDAGMPQDGDAAIQLVSDQSVHERIRDLAGRASGQASDQGSRADRGDQGDQGEDGWRIPPPELGEWQRMGSTAGLGEEALATLDRFAAPQPAGTLTQPLRLSGAFSALPTTGVLCTAGGMNIAAIETLVASGPPQFRALADPRVTFFELGTGHWPMLSAPAELAGVLLKAAAGEGRRLTAPEGERPSWLGPFLLDVPERPRERVGRADLYLPDADEPRPAVVFVHGGPIPVDMQPTPRDTPLFVGYSRYAADLGVVGVTVDHGLHALTDYARAAEDIAEAVELVRADPRVDGQRVALWFFSGGGLLTADWFAAPPPWLRCVAANYPILAPLPGWGMVAPRFRPVETVRAAGQLPIVLTRAGLESAVIAATVEEFLTAAEDCEAQVEVVDVPLGHHGFEIIDHTDRSRTAVAHAMRSVLSRLRS